ncbi:MAG: hypothetical protein J1E33_04580 [Alistipes sp.]|nr:hypothetical protein [Alistipes sp.]
MKLYRFLMFAMAGLIMTGCYNDFDMPAVQSPADRTPESMARFMEAQGLTHISIKDMKDLFGSIQDTGSTTELNKTVHKQFVSASSGLSGKDYIVGDYYIKGKVLTNDEQGNVYKSLFIWDGTAAIELKLTNGLFLDFPCDLASRKSVMVYVKLTDLYIGNYRMMLSIGDIPTEGRNAWGDYKYYANSNIVSPIKVAQHVFLGEDVTLNEGTDFNDPNVDILVVDNNSYKNLIPSGNYSTTDMLASVGPAKYFGRLLKLKGVKVEYKGVMDQNGDVPEPMKNGSYDNVYPSWICTSGLKNENGAYEQVVSKPWYGWAYSRNNVALYGQLCVAFPGADTGYSSNKGVYIVRTSGYSKFAGYNVPKNGTEGNVLGIYSIYTKYTNFQGGESDYATYQIMASRFEDLEFDMGTKEEQEDWAAWTEKTILENYMDSLTLPDQLINDEDTNSSDN